VLIQRISGYLPQRWFRSQRALRDAHRLTRRQRLRNLLIEPLEDRKLLTVIDLAAIGAGGTTIFGADAGDNSGISVGNAGDVNGDGYDDLIIGANLAASVGNARGFAGESYLIFGKADWSSTPSIDIASLGSAGVSIFGAGFSDRSGISVSGAGDFNGDGFDDFIIGASRAGAAGNAKSYAGESYVLFGGNSFTTPYHLPISAAVRPTPLPEQMPPRQSMPPTATILWSEAVEPTF
jgi:hypothetical protein